MELVSIEQANLTIMPTQSVVEYFLNNQNCPGTARTYGVKIRYFFIWTGGKSFRDITPMDALNYNEYLKSTKSPATVQNTISPLKQFFDFCVKWGLIKKNPFAIVKQKNVPNRANEKYLTVKELDKLLNALAEKSEKHYVLGLLLAATGMRISEAQQLSWNSFLELPDGTIAINVLRKGGNYKTLPLRNDVWEVIKAFTGKEIDPGDNSPLFLNPSGKRATNESLRTWIREGAKRAKIKKPVSPHTLRHTFCSLSIAAGASLRDVQEYAGHKRISTTEIYLHPQNMRVGEFMPLSINSDSRLP